MGKEDRRFQLTDPELIKFIDWYCEIHDIKKMDFTEAVFNAFAIQYFKKSFPELMKEVCK